MLDATAPFPPTSPTQLASDYKNNSFERQLIMEKAIKKNKKLGPGITKSLHVIAITIHPVHLSESYRILGLAS